MAVLHKKEEKIQAVLGRLPKKYTDEQFVEMFIRLYSKDWGKIKSAYIKQSQDKEPGSIINMPKPEIYLKQVLSNYLQNADAPRAIEVKEEVVKVPETKAEEPKVPAKKEAKAKEDTAEPKKTKAPARKKAGATEEPAAEVKKTKAAKKKEETTEEPVAEVKKTKAPAKKKAETAKDSAEMEKPKAAAKKPAAKK
ncbi:hypothetical protein ACFSOV_01310 [Pedobacter petrophilus]|uniref:hypothetical protein n=1 Tax=Pedobacter petrophilus TaxID=1908241 RepID=UPI001AE02A9D|nr:hypothetical protein [Pedobacter petrophilus]